LGEKALSWVTAENTATVAKLGDPKESPLYGRILSILENKEKIPMVRKIGDYYYNFWQVCEKGISSEILPITLHIFLRALRRLNSIAGRRSSSHASQPHPAYILSSGRREPAWPVAPIHPRLVPPGQRSNRMGNGAGFGCARKGTCTLAHTWYLVVV